MSGCIYKNLENLYEAEKEQNIEEKQYNKFIPVIYVLIPINNKNNTLKTKFTLVKEFAEVFVKNNPDYNLVSAEQIT